MVALEKVAVPQPGTMPQATSAHCTPHHLLVFKRSGMSAARSFPGHVERALVSDDLLDAYRLVHDVYVAAGYITPHETGMRLRAFEASPDMATFVGKVDSQVGAVMSIVRDSPDLGLPSDKAFGAELDALRKAGRRVAEVTNLAVRPEHRRSNVFFELMRACFAQTICWDCDNVFIAISPNHVPFFAGVLQFSSWGGRRSYSREVIDIVEGMTMDFRTISNQFRAADDLLQDEAFLHDSFYADNPFHGLCPIWERQATRAFRDPCFLGGLFVQQGGLLGRCSDYQLASIQRRWGGSVFAAACGRRRGGPEGPAAATYALQV